MRNFESIVSKEVKLASGEITPKDRLQNQIRLATEVFCRQNGFVDLEDDNQRNNIMLYWTDQKYSEIYRNMENSSEIQNHPRIKGNIFAITPDDIFYFKEHGKLSVN
jgi:hypothetical protein